MMAGHGILRASILAGALGPILFSLIVVVAGALRPGYDHVSQFISELGETGASSAGMMNYFGFMLSAALILLFVLLLQSRFPRSVTNAVGTFLLAVFAASVFLAGVFSCDAGCLPDNPSAAQKMHDLVSVLAFPAFTLGVFSWGVSLLRIRDWHGFGVYSLASASLSVLFLVLMIQSEATRDGTGMYQRLFLGVLFLWMTLFSIRLWRASVGTEKAPVS